MGLDWRDPLSKETAMHAQTLGYSLRSIRAGDLALLRRFVSRLSPDTAYKRLLSARTPSEDELQRWTAIDVSRERAVVATRTDADGEQLVGVARYVLQSAGEADFAIVLANGFPVRSASR
jgi:hypothetical protein